MAEPSSPLSPRSHALATALERAQGNDSTFTSFSQKDFKGCVFTSKFFAPFAEALKTNTHLVEIDFQGLGVKTEDAVVLAEALAENKTVQKFNLGYNDIGPQGIIAIGQALCKNSTVTELKIDRQSQEYGMAAEQELVKLWLTNVSLQRLYATLHDRTSNQDNSRGEVRNKEIARRKAAGLDWEDLDPSSKAEFAARQAEERAKAKEAKAAADAPISAKIESTGGPYTLKELTANKDFLPDDVDAMIKETYLSEEEFQSVFGVSKEQFAALPAWKKNQQKKDKNLH